MKDESDRENDLADQSDLGFCITGGHSIPHCMEVTARIEKINPRHRNYPILKNAVQEGKIFVFGRSLVN